MRVTELHIDRYGPLRGFSHTCEDNLEVFFGPNESGKTLLLESILKFLSPGIESVFQDGLRVSDQPTGHLYLEANGEEHQLGDGIAIQDVADISDRYLRNVFVVRDSDLELRDEHMFYDSVTQRIGDLHTNEIEAIQSEFVEKGRLTSLDGRGLSSAGYRDNAEDVRDAAESLATEIQEYIDQAETEDIAATEREFLAVKSQLNRCEEDLSRQEDAEVVDRHATLSDRLDDYCEAVNNIDEDISRETLETLRDLDRQIDAADDEIEDLKANRNSLREEKEELDRAIDEVEADLGPMRDREADIDQVEDRLESYREAHTSSIGASRGMSVAKYVAIAGVVLGGIGAIVGSTIAGVILGIIGMVSLGWFWLQHRSLVSAEQEREQLLEEAQDAGFDVTSIEEIGPAIREFRDELSSLEDQHDSLAQEHSVKDQLIDDREGDLDDERTQRREDQEELERLLREAGVDDLNEYRQAVEAQSDLASQRDRSASSLSDGLGEPAGEDPTPAEKIAYWENELDDMIADVDDSVTADMFDSDHLKSLRAERDRLTSRQDELDDELEAHDRRLDEFRDRIQALSVGPFMDGSVTLESHSIEGLRAVVPELEALVERIERDADIAREALDIFDALKALEEQKITDLFGEDSRATEVFRRITDDRYVGVRYDSGEQVLKVRRENGDEFTPNQLSQGAKTQLYLAARVGLANQLLTTDPGFFLMDDAFLPADGTRLREGFQVLKELAEDGWQILYFTAKDEVGEDLVEAEELCRRRLDPLT